jgi:hypothetical protein
MNSAGICRGLHISAGNCGFDRYSADQLLRKN